MDYETAGEPVRSCLVRCMPPIEWLPLLAGAWLLLLAPLATDDFFYLARSGECFLQTGRVLGVNLFSFTAPEHPWVNHAWLSGLLFHLADSALGLSGVVALNAACYLAAGLLFARNLRLCGAGPVARCLLLLAYAAVVAKPYAVVRPWIFAHILFQCLLGLWLVSREAGDPNAVRKRLGAGVFILLLWLNLHGSFYVGWLMFALLLLTLRLQPAPPIRIGEILLWAALAGGVLFLNPYGASYLVLPFQFLRGAVDANAGAVCLAHLEEWASVLSFSMAMDYLAAALFAGVAAFMLVKAARRQLHAADLPRAVFFAASTALILVAHRNDYFFLTANLCLFFPAGVAGGARQGAAVTPGLLARIRPCFDLTPGPKVAVLWCVVPLALFPAFSAARPAAAFLDPAFWPPRLLAHLERDPFYREQRGFWDFDLTNIPVYRTDLGLKTFFDLREYCYPEEVARDFLAFYGPRDGAVARVIQKWKLRYLVVRKGSALEAAVRQLCQADWPGRLSVRFEDGASRIYEITPHHPASPGF